MAIYAKMGNISGSVSTQAYKGCIDIHNYHMGHYRNATQVSGCEDHGNIGINKRTSVVFTKSIDNASSEMFDAYTSAKSIPEVVFYHVLGSDDKCRHQTSFKNVRINRYDTHAFADGALEEIEFTFMTHETRITPTDPTGKPMPAKSAGFDFIKMTSI